MSVLDFQLESYNDLQKVAEKFYRDVNPLSVELVLGVDIGRVQDHTAVALVEKREFLTDFDPRGVAYRKEKRLAVRYLERMPLGTSWPEVVRRLRDIQRSLDAPEKMRTMVVDATGVGDPVVSMIRDAKLVWNVQAVNITGGIEVSKSQTKGGYNVPKRDLITNLQLLMQQRRLKVAGGIPEAALLAKEMQAMQVRQSTFGQEQFACWREKEHDDLVLATALACWWATFCRW